MWCRPAILALSASLLMIASAPGCKKTGSPAPSPTALTPDTVVRIHWLGRRRLQVDADAYFFSRVWSLPETTRLQSQTFDRLSTGLWRDWLGGQAAAQIPASVLRPLFDDLVMEESCLEIRAAAGSPPAAVLAIHVNARRAGLWQTNAAIAAGLLAGARAVADPGVHGWTLRRTSASSPARITLSRVGDWTVVATGPEPNVLLAEITARIRRDGVPFVSAGTNLWLEASLDPSRLAGTFSRSAPGTAVPGGAGLFSNLNRLDLAVSGDGGNVITRASFSFSAPLPASLPPWQLPENLLHGQLAGFTALRGVQPWLADWPVWRGLQIGPPPDQLFLWSLAGSASQVYLAAPLPGARQQLSALTGRLLQPGDSWLTANGNLSFGRAPDGNGLIAVNRPDMKPFLKSAGDDAQGWLFAGLLPDSRDDATPPPAGMIQDVLRRPDLVYYDWEITGPRLLPCFQLAQITRLFTRQPQLPPDSAGVAWLRILEPRLGVSTTIINRAGPAELSLYRRSTLGLTAPELQFLTGWLASPQFPR